MLVVQKKYKNRGKHSTRECIFYGWMVGCWMVGWLDGWMVGYLFFFTLRFPLDHIPELREENPRSAWKYWTRQPRDGHLCEFLACKSDFYRHQMTPSEGGRLELRFGTNCGEFWSGAELREQGLLRGGHVLREHVRRIFWCKPVHIKQIQRKVT